MTRNCSNNRSILSNRTVTNKRVLATYKRGFLLEPDIRINPTRFQPGILLQCVGGSKLKTGSIWETFHNLSCLLKTYLHAFQ